MPQDVVALREYVEALLQERERADRIAAEEREKAAAAVREATMLAEQEREKAASAVRQATDRAIEKIDQSQSALTKALQDRMDAGDERLREHIQAQYSQIAQALDSARREASFAQEAAGRAIEKAEIANEKRFDSVNEFRGQLADQATQFLPREVYDTAHADVLNRVEALTRRLDQEGGRDTERASNKETSAAWQLAAASAGVTFFITAVVVVVNLVT